MSYASKRDRWWLAVVCICVAGALPGCTYLSRQVRIAVSLPVIPEEISGVFPPFRWNIVWPGADGQIETLRFTDETDPVVIEVPKWAVVPVAAEVESNVLIAGRLAAGAVVPHDLDSLGGVELTWTDGFLAGCLIDYVRSGGDPGWIDVDAVRSKLSAESGGNPWRIDRSVFLASMAAEDLSASSIRRERTYQVRLPFPFGCWAVLDPLETRPIRVSPTRGSYESEFTEGVHGFIDIGSGVIAEVYADDLGWLFVLNRDPETAVYERW